MNIFIVTVKDKADSLYSNLVCIDKDELGNLLLNFDDNKYEIKEITPFENVLDNWQICCKEEPKMETGGE